MSANRTQKCSRAVVRESDCSAAPVRSTIVENRRRFPIKLFRPGVVSSICDTLCGARRRLMRLALSSSIDVGPEFERRNGGRGAAGLKSASVLVVAAPLSSRSTSSSNSISKRAFNIFDDLYEIIISPVSLHDTVRGTEPRELRVLFRQRRN